MDCFPILLRDGFTEDDLAEVAEHRHLVWHSEIPEDTGRMFESIYDHTRLKVRVHYLEDSSRELRCLDVCGPDAEVFLDEFKSALPWVPPEEVRADALQSEDLERLRMALNRLYVLRELIPAEEIERSLQLGVSTDDPGVIDAVIQAISFFGWPSLRPLLVGLLGHWDEQVRDESAALLELFDTTAGDRSQGG